MATSSPGNLARIFDPSPHHCKGAFWWDFVRWISVSLFLKVAFFQKVQFVFLISKSKKKIFQKTILSLKFEFVFYCGKFQFLAQDSFLEYFVFRDLEMKKRKAPSSFKTRTLLLTPCSGLCHVIYHHINKKSPCRGE